MIASVVSLLIALVTPVILEWLKTQPWMPLINQATPTLNRITAVLVAVGQVVGVSFAFDADAGTLVIAGLSLGNIARMGVTALMAWITQEIVYRRAVNR